MIPWAVLAAMLAPAAQAAPVCPPEGSFRKIIDEAVGGELAVAKVSYELLLVDRRTGALLCEEGVNPDSNVYPASTFKTLVAFKLLEEIDRGHVRLSDPIEITQANADQECGDQCASYGKGKVVLVSKLLEDMITVSSNIATNQLIDLLGKPAINDLALRLGAPSLKVLRKVYSNVNPEPEIKERNQASAAGLATLYREIIAGGLGLLSHGSRELLIATLGRQKINGSLNGKFPADEKFYHKTGNTSEVTGDGGFYYLDDGAAAVIVGLQGFTQTHVCATATHNCETITGFESLRRAGKSTYDLLKAPSFSRARPSSD